MTDIGPRIRRRRSGSADRSRVAKGWVALGLVQIRGAIDGGLRGDPRSPFFIDLLFHDDYGRPIGRIDRSSMSSIFDPSCRRCTRLASFLDSVKHENPEYYCKPVPPFGDPGARLLIVGLAPGMHGANRTGRPFTGDHAGILLYGTLHKLGFASAATSTDVGDGLRLEDARITNSVKCLPPANKPLPQEIKVCNAYLEAELAQSPQVRVVLALGTIAHAAVLRAVGLKAARFQICPCGRACNRRGPGAVGLLSLQPLQHPDTPSDDGHVRGHHEQGAEPPGRSRGSRP